MKTLKFLTACLFLIGVVTKTGAVQSLDEQSMEAQISEAKLFDKAIIPVGKPNAAETKELWSIVTATNADIPAVERFVSTHPHSTWAASLHNNLANYYRHSGRYTDALSHWNSAWEQSSKAGDLNGNAIAEQTLVGWLSLLSSLGRTDDLRRLIEYIGDRPVSDRECQLAIQHAKHAIEVMNNHPEKSYRCGTFALYHVAKEMGAGSQVLRELLEIDSPNDGFSVSNLITFTEKYGLHLAAVKRSSGQQIVVPSVVHWRENHYGAIVEYRDGLYKVTDPTFGRARWLTADAINHEVTGYFLVPIEKIPKNWQPVTTDEAATIHGKGFDYYPPLPPPPNCDHCSCPPGASGTGSGNSSGGRGSSGGGAGGGCPTCGSKVSASGSPGMPTWRVTEPYISLWLDDTPLSYHTSLGTDFKFQLSYHQRETRTTNAVGGWTIFNFGPDWNCNWLSYLDVTNATADVQFSHFDATEYHPLGGQRSYSWADSAPDSRMHSKLVRMMSGATLIGFKLQHPDGAETVYGLLQMVSSSPPRTLAMMTEQHDSQGRTTYFRYSLTATQILLTNVVDFDGRTNVLSYNGTDSKVIQIDVPKYSYSAKLNYDSIGILTNIEDAVGLKSSFQYTFSPGGLLLITNLHTAYGDTAFDYYGPDNDLTLGSSDWELVRNITVTQPDGGKHLFAYYDYVGGAYLEPSIYRHSLYWSPRQYSLLSTTDFTHFNADDLTLARNRHWLHDSQLYGAGEAVSPTLGVEQGFSPGVDDTGNALPGAAIFYDYSGSPDPGWFNGTNDLPSAVSYTADDGTIHTNLVVYNEWGKPIAETETFTVSGITTSRTKSYSYATNGIDVITVTNFSGTQEAAYDYNNVHQILHYTNAVGDVTTNLYDTTSHLLRVQRPTGLTTTNIYINSGDFAGWLGSTIDLEIGRTNFYTYTNGLLYTHTDERGLTVTNYWDNLQRLTGTGSPSGLTTNVYDKLDILYTVDRLGYPNGFAYDAMRRMIRTTNALQKITINNYCNCGSLEFTVDALGNTNRYFYDTAGRQTGIQYGDNSIVTYNLDSLGRVTNVIDGAVSITNWYNAHGLLAYSSNAFGQIFARLYDIEDRITNSTDANGVVTTNSYDQMGRLIARGYPANGAVEQFAYSSRGMTAYTNQLTNFTYFTYDAATRKTAETNALLQGTQFEYDSAGDLIKLTDPRTNTTTWGYDVYGRVIAKTNGSTVTLRYAYDAEGNLTNRWSAAKTNTFYKYDAVGNLTNITYQASGMLTYSYDALNRLTNMTDSVGTTKFSYTTAGLIQQEDGPWDGDAVTYSYDSRRRTSMSIQVPNSGPWRQSYSYDNAGRLSTTTSPAGTFTYSYHAGLNSTVTSSSLVKKLLLPDGAFETNTFDNLGRISTGSLKTSGGTILDSTTCFYDAGNRRTTIENGSRVQTLGYDKIGQLVSDSATEWGGSPPRFNEQLAWSYDSSGNLHYRTNNTLVESFENDTFNQLTNSANSGNITVIGTTTTQATNVTVNGNNASVYADATFAATNLSRTVTYTAVASDGKGRRDTNTINVNIATSALFTYDANGNLLSDGERGYTWNDENQLIAITVTNKWQSQFAYDGKLRRRVETNLTWNGSTFVPTNVVRFVYDGNLPVQHRDGQNLPTTTLTRGKDLSGSLAGAGGIGGLLAMTERSTLDAQPSTSFYHSDASGNVTMLINSAQAVVAKYLYEPFGTTLSISGQKAYVNSYRFSSKPIHERSGIYDYLYRAYDAQCQRWINRDPVYEAGGINLYSYLGNRPSNYTDPEGLAESATVGLPIYNPGWWNDPSRKDVNNCYNYASDKPSGGSTPQFWQPGAGSQLGQGNPSSCANMRYRILGDGGQDTDSCGNCPPGTHKIRPFIGGPNGDFHFYREDRGGSWSHKRGSTPAGPVSDPSQYNGYEKCPDMCVQNTSCPG